MDHRERRVAQIVRDFLEAYQLSAEIHEALAQGGLDFARVARLVGDSEESALYRLKEECHALFRLDGERSSLELDADELFDLEVAALFHEGMKFRESYYLTTTYGPRLERMMAEGSATGPLAGAFLRLFEAGRRRMRESGSEVASLFRELLPEGLAVLDERLGDGRPFVAGGQVSVADCTLQAAFQFARFGKVDLGDFEHLTRWDREYRARPAARAVLVT